MMDEEVTDLEAQADEAQVESTDGSREDAEIIARAKKNFKVAQEANSEILKEGLEDYKFRAGQQWPEEIKNAREQDKRPCITVNQIPQFVNQVVNDLRQNRPSIHVDPTGDGAQVETAEVLQGMVRHIEYASNADIAYDRGADGQATGGFGYWRVVTEYANAFSFDLELKIKSVKNPFSVLLDPSHQEPDGSDTTWGHVFDDITREEFKALYPNAKLSLMADWDSLGNNSEGWISKTGCRIDEYFEKEFIPTKLYMLSNGKTILGKDLPKPPATLGMDQQGQPITFSLGGDGQPLARDTVAPKVMWYKLNGIEILDRSEFPSRFIPIIPVYGSEFIIEGERILEGVVRHARDPQRMYNFYVSYEAETIALAPKAPWIGAAGQFEGHEEKWETANTRNHAFMEYNETTESGKPSGPPIRNQFEPPVQAITNARMASQNDLKSTTGIYDTTLGDRKNDPSGRAVERLANQAQTSNFHYSDNMGRSIRHTGTILIDAIPKVYDTARAVRIIDEEDEQKIIWINKLFEDKGEQKFHDLSVGTYDVTIKQGPSYQTKRQEFVSSALDLVKANPPIFGFIGDLLVKNMDWEGADAIADRLKKMLPPQLQDGPEGQPPLPPQVQQQMAQMQAMLKNQSALISKQDEVIRTKQLELSSKERIAMAGIKADIEINLAKLGSQSAQVMLEHNVGHIDRRLDLLGEQNPIGTEPDAGGNTAVASGQNQPSTGGSSPGSNQME